MCIIFHPHNLYNSVENKKQRTFRNSCRLDNTGIQLSYIELLLLRYNLLANFQGSHVTVPLIQLNGMYLLQLLEDG